MKKYYSMNKHKKRIGNKRKVHFTRFNKSKKFHASSSRGNFSKKTIDIQSFITKASVTTERKQYAIQHTFDDFYFCNQLNDNLEKMGFIKPTAIQDQAILPILKGKEVIGLADTGTGKTAAFLLPLIDRIYHDNRERVLIIVPTRELAMQIDSEFRKFSDGMKIFSSVCIGGSPIHFQLKSLKRNPNVIIGTPGRIEDLAKRKKIVFKTFNTVVLDEVDRMLDMGFIKIVQGILRAVAYPHQFLFFSATLPDAIKKFIYNFSADPYTIQVQTGYTTENVSHGVVRIKNDPGKYEQLIEILGQPESEKILIFNETKRDVIKLTSQLHKKGFKVDSIHGDKRQKERQRSLRQFRNNSVSILVATDVAARGLDIKGVTHVINYTIPKTYDDYVHRIGRTGRGSHKGTALTFI